MENNKQPKRGDDPYKNFRFKVEIDGILKAGFREVTVPDSTQDVIEYREGTDSITARKMPGLNKYGNISLKWGITDSMDLYNWRRFFEEGDVKADRRNIAITLMDDYGENKARWEIVEAWPIKYDAPDFNATSNEVAVELLEIAHEGIKRVS